jgi:hypothetical protein
MLSDLQALISEYWSSVDRIADVTRSSASFYTDAGEMHLGSLQVQGREALEAFFTKRSETEIANNRTTRHLAANFRIHDADETHATVVTLVLVYSGIGEIPLPSQPPSAVGDFTFICERDPHAGWRFAKVIGTSVFIGAGAPNFAKR